MSSGAGQLRVIDFGPVSAKRSQTLWHGLARGVGAGSSPTLSFCQPTAPYVSIGFHSSLGDVDLDYCRRVGLPVFRRMVGGGPVYLDPHQYFFQIIVPPAAVPATRAAALRYLLAPVVEAFRAAGVEAALDEHHEIAVGDQKICGHAAGEIDGAVVVVGNLITEFDHESAARILAAPHADAGAELLELMRRYVAATPRDPDAFRSAAVAAYAGALQLEPSPGGLSTFEAAQVELLDGQLGDEEWLAGPVRPERKGWRAKVRAGVWVYAAAAGATRLTAAFQTDRLARLRLVDPDLDGSAEALGASLHGLTAAEAVDALSSHGAAGRRIARLLAEVAGAGHI